MKPRAITQSYQYKGPLRACRNSKAKGAPFPWSNRLRSSTLLLYHRWDIFIERLKHLLTCFAFNFHPQMSDDDRSLFLNKEPFRRLCNELRDLINHPSDVLDRPSDPLALKDYMFQYSKQKFAERFNFEFDGDNSKPPNSKAGGRHQTSQVRRMLSSIG